MRTRKGIHRARTRGAMLTATVAFLAISMLTSGVSAGPLDDLPQLFPEDDPQGEVCWLVADYTDPSNDLDQVTKVDTGRQNPPDPDNENHVGSPGTQEAESGVLHPVTEDLYSADADHMIIIDKETGAVVQSFPPFGTGNGSQGAVNLKDVDGLAFDPDTSPPMLFATHRRSSPKRDLLFQVDPDTGLMVPGAFNGDDYVVIDPSSDPTPTSPVTASLDDADDISFGGEEYRYETGPFQGRLRLWSLINRSSRDPHLVYLKRDGDPALYAGGFTGNIEDVGFTGVHDTEGMGWSQSFLWATVGKDGDTGFENSLWKVDPNTGLIDQSETRQLTVAHDYEGIACPIAGLMVEVEPDYDLNNRAAGEVEHTFVVRIKFAGQPVFGAVPDITLDGNLANDVIEVENTCADPGTDVNGECRVTYRTTDRGTLELTATYTHQTDTGANVGPASDTGTKVWVDLTKGRVCPVNHALAGQQLEYTISLGVGEEEYEPGEDPSEDALADAVLTDNLPPEVFFQSASAINGVTPTTPAPNTANGMVTWTFATLPAGDYDGLIIVQLAQGLPDDTEVDNEVSLTVNGVTTKHTHTTIIGASGSGDARAFGVRADILGGGLILGDPDIEATPDSDVQNPDELLAVPNPAAPAGDPLVRLLRVQEGGTDSGSQVTREAEARTAEVDINIPGVLQVEADGVIAKSSSHASGTTAGSTAAGSTVANLRVNGTQHGDISEPVTITVNDPISGNLLAEVYVLQRIPGGAAAGVPQPSGGQFASSMTVNGIHVVVHDIGLTPIDESSDIIVAHATSSATFDALVCPPNVSGDAFILEVSNVRPNLAYTIVGDVKLPSTGGSESEHLTDIDLPVIGTIDTAVSEVNGSVTEIPATAEAFAQATVEDADLLGGVISALLVQATSETNLHGSTGDTIIADLVIGGTNVCNALGLQSTCQPDPNEEVTLPAAGVIVRLNEQIPEVGGLTVNAVHIFVVGENNPLNLPVGAEIIISSAHSDAHPFGG